MEPLNRQPHANQVYRLEEFARYSMEALELCASLGDYQTSLTKFKNRKDIFERAVQGLRQIIPISFYAFYSVDDSDFDITLEHSDRREAEAHIVETVDYLIEKNIVSRAFREKRTLTARSPDRGHTVLIHALTTTSLPYGIFFGFMESKPLEMSIADKITTIIIKSTCYALENFDLYRLIDQKNNELMEKNIRLSESEIIYRNIFENTGNPTVIVTSGGLITYCNSRFLSFSGWDREHLLGRKKITDFLDARQTPEFPALLENSQPENPDDSPSYVFDAGFDWKKTVFLSVSPLGLENQYIISITDVTTTKEIEKKLHHQAFHDPLTGLPNRMLLRDRLGQAVKRKKRHPEKDFAVIFIDLDRFKSVNDALGHAGGDKLLIMVAERLAASLRDVDTAARFGGDEFVILLEGVSCKKGCQSFLERLLDIFRRPFDIDKNEIFIDMSIGVLISSRHSLEENDMLRLADMSMYEAKKRGPNRVVYCHEIEEADIEKRLFLENQLQKGIQREEFFLQYQPLIHLEDNALYGVEALVRWRHPELGIIPPNIFIPIAEETGLIIPLGRKIIEQAFRDYAGWIEKLPGPAAGLSLCINLSVKQVMQADIVDDIKSAAENSGIGLGNVCIEITESLFIDDTGRVADTIAKLKDLGISISIDDFGTGYSSLQYLSRFAIDMVKIDRLLINNITEDKTNYNIVLSMLQLCESLDLAVMAEGIEDWGQLEKLLQMKCRLGQGFYFAPPQEREAIGAFFAAGAVPVIP